MKYSWKDLILVGLTFFNIVIIVLPFIFSFSVFELVLLGLVNSFLIGMNYQCVSHNFIHNPFFKNDWVNNVYSMLNSICLGVPQSLYDVHHLNHHRYNNDPEKDESSTYRHGKNGNEENVFSYSLLGILRTDMVALFLVSKKKSNLVVVETIFLLTFFGILLFLNWKLFIVFFLSSWYFGQVFALAENYAEHRGAKLHDRQRDSVSCYNSIYNWLWFNNGYHQEHHFRPQVHWTKLATVQHELPTDRKIVSGFHLTNLF